MSKRLSRRGFLKLGAGALAATALASCAPKATEKPAAATPAAADKPATPAEKQHDISFAWWTGGEGANALFEEAVDHFVDSHPNFTVNRMPISAEFTTKILTMYGSGNAPDCHGVGWGTVWAWADKGILLDLTPLVESDPDIDWDDMWPAVTGGCYYPPGEKIIALPRESFGLMLFVYNKTIFGEAGVSTPDQDYEAGEWTWEKWREKAKALAKFGSDGRRQLMGANAWGADYWALQAVMPSYGVSMFNDDQTHFNLDDPKIVGWIKMLPQMMNDDRSIGKPEETQEFDWGSSGKLAIYQTATWEIPNMKETWADIEWDFVPPPKGTCCHANFVGADYHSVNGSDYADQEGGWELIKFINSPAEDLWWASNFYGAPFRRSSVEEWRGKLNQAVPKNGWKYMMEMTESATPWTPIPFQDELSTILGNEIGQAVSGERPADEVVSSITTQIDEMIAKRG